MKAKRDFGIGITVLLFGAALLAASVWFALYTMSTQSRAEAAASQVIEDARRSTYALSVRSLLREVAKEEAAIMRITDNRDIVAFVQLLEDTGAQAKATVSVDAVSLSGKDQTDPNLEEYIVAMRAEGSFQDVVRFVALVEVLPHPLYLEQVLIEEAQTGWEATLRIRTFLDSEESRKGK